MTWAFRAPCAGDCLSYPGREALSEPGSVTQVDDATSLFDGRLAAAFKNENAT